MECRHVNAILDEHRLATLSSAERGNLDAHLAGCDACADAFAVWETLGREAVPGPRPELFAELCEQIRKSTGAAEAGSVSVPPTVSANARRSAILGSQWTVFGGLAVMAALVLLSVTALLAMQSRAPLTPPVVPVAGITGESLPGPAFPQPSLLRPGTGSAFVDGQQYLSLPGATQIQSLGDRLTVWLFFMWSCLHCYEFDAELAAWLDAQDPDVVELVRVPVQWNPRAEIQARAFFAAEMLGVADAVSAEVYAAIHDRRESIETRDRIAAVFAQAGIDRAAFSAAFDSPQVDAVLASARAVAEAFGIDATPSIVVGSAYRTDPGMAGSTARMLDAVDWLLEREFGSENVRRRPDPDNRVSAEEAHRRRVREFTQRPTLATEALQRPRESCQITADTDLESRIRDMQSELDRLLLTYTEEYPDVIARREALEALEGARSGELKDILETCIERDLFQ